MLPPGTTFAKKFAHADGEKIVFIVTADSSKENVSEKEAEANSGK